MKFKVVLTVIVLLMIAGLNTVFYAAQGPVESSIAVKQLEDSAASYTAAQKVAEGHLPKVWNIGGCVLLGLMWAPTVVRKFKD